MGSYTTYYHLYVTDGSDYVDPTTDWSQNFVNLDATLHLKADDDKVVHLAGNETIAGSKTFGANINLQEGVNVVVGTATGTRIGTSSSQKLGFFGASPLTQRSGSEDVLQSLVDLGFRATSNNPPLNLGSGALTAGAATFNSVSTGSISSAAWTSNDANAIVTFAAGTVHGTVFGSNNTTSKVAFFGSTPVVQIAGSTDVVAGMVTLGLRGATNNPPLNIGSGALTAGAATLAATTVTTLGTAGNVTLTDGNNVVVGSSSGTQIATATSQKLGFFGASPVIQITGSTDVLAGLVTLGFRAASSNPPLNLGTGALTAGVGTFGASASTSGQINLPNNKGIAWKGNGATPADEIAILFDANDILNIGNVGGIVQVANATARLGFYGATPVSQLSGATDVLSGLVTLGLRGASNNPPLNLGTGALTAGVGTFGASASTTGQINLPNNKGIAWKGNGATPGDEIAILLDSTDTLQIGAAGGIIQVADSTSRVGFFGTTPISRQQSASTTTGYTAGSSTAVTIDGKFTGNLGSTAYTLGDIVLALKKYGLLLQ